MSEERKPLAITDGSNNDSNINSNINNYGVRDILKQRFRSNLPRFKKTLPFLMVGVVCFSLGIGTGFSIKKHNIGKFDDNKAYSMERNFDSSQKNDEFRNVPKDSRR